MRPIGVLRNPRSSGNLRRSAAAPTDGVILRETAGEAALGATLEEFRRAGIAALLIDGGDGTVRETLSRLPEAFDGAPPPVAIAPRGNTNLIAREVGGWRGPDAAARLLEALARRRATAEARPVLRVDREGEPPLRGFILGLGLYAEATELARREIGARGARQVALAVLRTLGGAIRSGSPLRRGAPAALSADGRPLREGRRLIAVATTLQRPLVLGLDPFWGEGQGALRWLDVLAPGERLLRAAPRVALGRPAPWMTRSGYDSGRARSLRIETAAPVVLDGEAFASGQSGALHLTAEDGIVFLAPEPPRGSFSGRT